MNPSSFAILSLVFTSEHISGQPTGPQPTGQQPIDVECCKEKTVGGVGYLHVEQGEVPAECKSRCIYSRVDNPNSRFCFAVGDLPVTCGFPPESCKAVLLLGTCIITEDNCTFGWPYAAPPACNCECGWLNMEYAVPNPCIRNGLGYKVETGIKGNLIQELKSIPSAEECGKQCQALGGNKILQGWTYLNSNNVVSLRNTCYCLDSLNPGSIGLQNRGASGLATCPPIK